MKKPLFLSILVLSFFVGIAQENQPNLFNGINLNSYKLTDYRYRTLLTSLNASSENEYLNDNVKSSTNSFNSSCSGQYTSTKYSRRYIGYQSLGLSIRKESSKSEYDTISWNKNFSTSLNFSYNTNNSFYITNDFFFEVDFRSIIFPTNYYSKNEHLLDVSKTNQNNFSINNQLILQVGKGRIEDVSDARTAIYILDDLQKQGRLSRTLDQQEVFEFADFITKTLNKRVIDSRIKRIKEYVAIDSFLVAKGLTTKTDGLYFGLINDNWNYARTQYWLTGSKLYFGVSPFLGYYNRFYKRTENGIVAKNRTELTQYGISINTGYQLQKITGLKWKKSLVVEGSLSIYKFDTVGFMGNYKDYKTIDAYARYIISYVPNTRTEIIGQVLVNANKRINERDSDQLYIYPSIKSECYYYISEKLKLTADAGITYYFDKQLDPDHTKKELDFGFNITLNYTIF